MKVITKSELASEYNVHIFTLRRWLSVLIEKKIILYKKRYILPKEAAIIRWFLDGVIPPSEMNIDILYIERILKDKMPEDAGKMPKDAER